MRELSPLVSNWRAPSTLHSLLAAHGVAGIRGIDTRAVTRRIRHRGAQRALITRAVDDPGGAVAGRGRHPSLEGRDLVREVTRASPTSGTRGCGARPATAPRRPPPVSATWWPTTSASSAASCAACVGSGCRVTVVPAATSAAEVLAMKPDGVFLSNGPGDPAAVGYAVDAVAELSRSRTPVFGICLGHQILGLALGGKTYKLKFGHHGANHPVMDLTTRKVEITSQNHGFAVDVDSLEGRAVLTHVNLNDNTVEGMRHDRLPVFSVQYHPEASPGPERRPLLFERFVKLMDERSRT